MVRNQSKAAHFRGFLLFLIFFFIGCQSFSVKRRKERKSKSTNQKGHGIKGKPETLLGFEVGDHDHAVRKEVVLGF